MDVYVSVWRATRMLVRITFSTLEPFAFIETNCTNKEETLDSYIDFFQRKSIFEKLEDIETIP